MADVAYITVWTHAWFNPILQYKYKYSAKGTMNLAQCPKHTLHCPKHEYIYDFLNFLMLFYFKTSLHYYYIIIQMVPNQ